MLSSIEGGHKLRKANEEIMAKTDHHILELALQDISQIWHVVSSGKSAEALTNATHLLAAYQQFLRKMRVEHNYPRTWENLPNSQVCGCSATQLLV